MWRITLSDGRHDLHLSGVVFFELLSDELYRDYKQTPYQQAVYIQLCAPLTDDDLRLVATSPLVDTINPQRDAVTCFVSVLMAELLPRRQQQLHDLRVDAR
jgi:hypothetical protein